MFLPPGIVHRQQCGSGAEPVHMIVARSSRDGIVVVVDDDPHAPAHDR